VLMPGSGKICTGLKEGMDEAVGQSGMRNKRGEESWPTGSLQAGDKGGLGSYKGKKSALFRDYWRGSHSLWKPIFVLSGHK
jgi:hypothetical protein